jgi:serine/threonine protein kinase
MTDVALGNGIEKVASRAAGAEPLPGYRLIEPLGRGGFGEVWKCEVPGGLFKAIKFVGEGRDISAGADNPLNQELAAFQRVKAIRHPFLLMLERVELVGGELVMVMELADQSLQTRFDECRAAGLPGIPRDELLGCLTEAAEVLDLICSRHGLQHLDIKPANLFLVCGHLKVGDYGMVAGVEPAAGPGAAGPRCFTPKYTAPEVLTNRVHPQSDQYCLALVFQELLTGRFPYAATSAAKLMIQHASAAPDLTPLPAADQAVIGRALAKDPADRFPSCTAFVEALKSSPSDPGADARLMAKAPALRAPSEAQREPAPELASVFPGYRVVEEVETGPRGCVVLADAPGGERYRVRLLGGSVVRDPQVCAIVAGARAIDHPGVVQRVGLLSGSLAAFAAPADRSTLAALFRTHVAEGRPGVPRRDLLDVLAGVARTLDEVCRATRLAHLALHPAVIFVADGSAQLTDLGLGELLRRSPAEAAWGRHVPYVAPELAGGAAGPASDQFSLALIFLEMTRAWAPSEQRPATEWGVGLRRDRVTDVAWRVLRKALHPAPAKRFADCSEFLAALRAAVFRNGEPQTQLDDLPPVIAVARLTGQSGTPALHVPPTKIAQAVAYCACPADSPHWVGCEPVQRPDASWMCRFPVKLLPGMVELKVRVLQEQWQCELSQPGPSTFMLTRYRPGGFWTKLTGKKAGIELLLCLPEGDQVDQGAGYAQIAARLVGAPHAGGPGASPDLLPELIGELRRQVQNLPDRRRRVRVPAELPVMLYPVNADGEVFRPIMGRGRDLSAGGFSCFTTAPMPTEIAYVEFGGGHEFVGQALLAKLLRTMPDSSGGLLVAGRFADER